MNKAPECRETGRGVGKEKEKRGGPIGGRGMQQGGADSATGGHGRQRRRRVGIISQHRGNLPTLTWSISADYRQQRGRQGNSHRSGCRRGDALPRQRQVQGKVGRGTGQRRGDDSRTAGACAWPGPQHEQRFEPAMPPPPPPPQQQQTQTHTQRQGSLRQLFSRRTRSVHLTVRRVVL